MSSERKPRGRGTAKYRPSGTAANVSTSSETQSSETGTCHTKRTTTNTLAANARKKNATLSGEEVRSKGPLGAQPRLDMNHGFLRYVRSHQERRRRTDDEFRREQCARDENLDKVRRVRERDGRGGDNVGENGADDVALQLSTLSLRADRSPTTTKSVRNSTGAATAATAVAATAPAAAAAVVGSGGGRDRGRGRRGGGGGGRRRPRQRRRQNARQRHPVEQGNREEQEKGVVLPTEAPTLVAAKVENKDNDMEKDKDKDGDEEDEDDEVDEDEEKVEVMQVLRSETDPSKRWEKDGWAQVEREEKRQSHVSPQRRTLRQSRGATQRSPRHGGPQRTRPNSSPKTPNRAPGRANAERNWRRKKKTTTNVSSGGASQ